MDNLFIKYDPSSVLETSGSSSPNRERFRSIYEGLDSSARGGRQRRSLKRTGILLEDGNVVGRNDVDTLYFPPSELDLKEFDATPDPLSAIEAQLDIVDRTLASDDTSRSVLGNANVKSLIITTIISRWLEEIDWSKVSNSDRLLTARLYCESYHDESINRNDIPLLLKTASNEWEQPAKLFMAVRYQPNDPVQKLQKFDWFDEKSIREFWTVFQSEGVAISREGPQFVSDEYLELSESLGLDEWREFFYELGVDGSLHDGKIDQNLIGCLGELYVHSQLHKHSETNIQNVYIGRDIVEKKISESPNTSSVKRIIEVKSTKDANKIFELTAPQTDVLEQYDSKYFIYRVTRVLDEPKLRIASAADVDAVAEKKIKLNDAAWRSIATSYEDHRQS
jgi:hypothetical protein